MALDSVPWFIGGGAEHSPAIARQLAYAATNGATGINAPGDLRVTALPTPGSSVRIMPGGAVMLNLYPGGGQQSYTCRNPSATDIAVPATGSSGGATRYVILRVDDPEFGGQAPSNVKNGPYVRAAVVSSITNLAYPFIPLARITQPANTATITQAMIRDLRELANPRTARVQRMARGVGNVDLRTQLPNFQDWPGFVPEIEVPSWATRVQASVNIFGVGVYDAGTLGDWELVIGWAPGPVLISDLSTYDFNQFGTASNPMRAPAMGLILDRPVPETMRGTTQTIRARAGRSLASGNGYLRADHQTQTWFDIWFLEDPS